jgi:hypothetical protein
MKMSAHVISFGLLISGGCCATSLMDRDVNVLFERSVSVLEGRVIGIEADCKNRVCKSAIRVAVEKRYKGENTQSTEEVFCSGVALAVGFSYVFFIESAEKAAKLAGCEVVAEPDAVFSRFNRDVYRYMSPDSFRPAEIGSKKYLTGWVLVEEFDELVLQARKRQALL